MAKLNEVGRIGQRRSGGIFYEEFLQELSGKRGIAVYKEMADNDDVIGAILFAVEMLIRQATWTIQPVSAKAADVAAAEFVQSCMDDMSSTWTDTISEVLSFLTFGWSAHEIVYKRRCGKSRDQRLRSKHTDGLIGWQKLPIRSQDTLWEWLYDGADNLVGMAQMPPPEYHIIQIPREKLLLFRTKSRKDSPEGRSLLRNAYRSWYFKRRIQEIEGIGIERDLAGLPMMTAPEDVDIWDTEDPVMEKMLARATAMVKDIRRDSMEGLVIPAGWKFELATTGGRRQFDTNAIIERYDTRIAMTVLADFVLLGHQQVGSFALSSDKTELFAMAIGAYLDIICEVFNNQAIPALIDINGATFGGISDYPQMTHGDIEDEDIEKLGGFIRDMTGVGVLTPDDGLEDHIRRVAGLPERMDDYGEEPARARRTPPPDDDDTNDDVDDDEQVAAAKARLGRPEGAV